MARYVVMEPAEPIATATRLAGARIVRDGFHFLGFIFPPFWLLWHGLLIEAVVAFAALFGIAAAGELTGFGLTASLLSLLVSFYVGLEGSALRLAALRRRGWREWRAVEADDMAEAEIRAGYGMVGPPVREAETGNVSRPALPWNHHRPGTTPALGLLGYSGRL